MKALWALLALLLFAGGAQAQDRDTQQRMAFRAALEAARRGELPAEAPLLRHYALTPYLSAARLLTLLPQTRDASLDAETQRFLDAQGDWPVAGELRRAWLLQLAARQAWPQFLAQYPADSKDSLLQCWRWQARIALASEEPARRALAPELLAFWREAPQLPPPCNPVFDWLAQQQVIGDADREARARKALEAGNADFAAGLIAALPPERAAPLKQWLSLLDDPRTALAALAADAKARIEAPALIAGFTKLARRDADAAAQLLPAFAPPRISASEQAELTRSLGLALAWNRDARALDYFQKLSSASALADTRSAEWRIRAALWNQSWTLAAQWLDELPVTMAQEPRWRYWRARVEAQLGHAEAARSAYENLAQDNGYYALLAAHQLDRPYRPRWRQLAEDLDAQNRLLRSVALTRARELFYVGEISWANAEWRSATQNLNEAERIQAARLASRWGWHWQTVLTLNQLDASDALDLLYPRAFTQEIALAAQDAQLPSDWVYGVMRQESLFLPQAVSSADALGLLQLKLDTARDVARKIGLPRPQREELFQPQLNLRLGSAYLQQINARYDGQFVPTICAYNAGPNAVARWLPPQPMAADIWIENVPYNETRGYVQRILWHIAVHSWQLSGQTREIDSLLQPVRKP